MVSKNILIVGRFISHVVGSKIELLRAMGYGAQAFDTNGHKEANEVYQPDNFYSYRESDKKVVESRSVLARSVRAARQLGLLSEESHRLDIAKMVLNHFNPNIIWGVWGTIALNWLRVFLRAGFDGKIIWTANVLPEAIETEHKFRRSFELQLYRRWLPEFDGLILTEQRMLDFLHRYVSKARQLNFLLMPDYLPQSWFALNSIKITKNCLPKVVYLGAPERYVNKIDSVDELLIDLVSNGIHVHCARPKEAAIQHEKIHFYDRYSDRSFVSGEFADFIAMHDAVIVMYAGKGHYPRFASTYPTRFVMALCGRVPVFVKKGLLFACEDFVERNGIGKSYSNGKELKSYLDDMELMIELRTNALENQKNFASDTKTNRMALQHFIEKI